MTTRIKFSLALISIAVSLWFISDDFVELILKQREILFGIYSSGGFSARLLLTLILGGLALLLLDRKKSIGEAVGALLMVTISTVITLVLFIYATTFMRHYFLELEARYVESKIITTNTVNDNEVPKLAGVTRHRPPNKRYEFSQSDLPKQHRSYPLTAPGYKDLNIVLTSDKYGFRNHGEIKDQYSIIAVGDSFAAGSHVADEQGCCAVMVKTDVHKMTVAT